MHSPAKTASEASFDSSVELNSIAGTASTASIPDFERPRVVQDDFQQQDLYFNVQSTPEKKFSFNQPDNMGGADMFIGFKKGWGGKEVKINESKIKKAKMFFDDTQELQEKEFFSVPFGFGKSQKKQYDESGQEFQFEDYTMPCFKSVGTGLQVKVSKEMQSKAKILLNQFQSYKKPTKLKKGSNLFDQTYIKTINQNKPKEVSIVFDNELKVKKKTISTEEFTRKSFNWQQYEKQYREEIERDMKRSKSKSKEKKNTSKKKRKQQSMCGLSGKELQLLKLSALSLDLQTERIKSNVLSEASKDIAKMIFSHNWESCSAFKCVLCSIKYSNPSMDLSQIYKVMVNQFSKKWIKFQQFQPIYEEVCFKLLKYSYFWPELANKQCLPSNLIVQISKKMLKIATEMRCSYLKQCLLLEQIGRKITLIVREKYVNQKMNIVFLRLSDGWISVWTAIESHNLLHSYLIDENKVRVGTKLCICLWILHPISNILQFCNRAQPQDTCLQFFYNGSIIMQPNSKLGFTPPQFYRPLHRCRSKGGLIPLVEGFIIRFFTIREKGKKVTSFSHHYAQILTPESRTQLIKFVLGQENSLVQFFRLYRCYNFYRLKINEESTLSFCMASSKFEEIKVCKISEKEMVYPETVLKLLQKRLINCQQSHNESSRYDLLCEKGQLICKNGSSKQILMEDQLIDRNSVTLYQQVSLVSVTNNCYIFRKNKYSSQPKRIPPIYQLINKKI